MFQQDPSDAPDVQIFRTSRHVARKAKKCGCGRTIQPGTEYTLTVGTEDGVFYSVAFCVDGLSCNPRELENQRLQFAEDKAWLGAD